MPVATAKQKLSSHLDALCRSDLWLAGQSKIIAAVSGGPDSLALALICKEVCAERTVEFEAVVVNHGLRLYSAQEARQVVDELLRHRIVAYCHAANKPAPVSGQQAWAREQRLQILCNHARQTGSAVLFAHHRDDQAETVAMRLLRDSGLVGLSAIAACSVYQGVLFGRPFLKLSKAQLVAVCREYDAHFICDPSNTDYTFERVRVRTWLQNPAQQIFHAQLLKLSDLSSRLSVCLAEEKFKWCAQHARFTHRLRACLDAGAFFRLRATAQKLILRHCLAFIGAQPYPVSDERLDRLLMRLQAGHNSTSGGCFFEQRKDAVTITAEFGRLPAPQMDVRAEHLYCFDRRWLVLASADGVVRRLGAEGWAQEKKNDRITSGMADWSARMGAMIPVFQGLDDQLIYPHFKSYEAICSFDERVQNVTDNTNRPYDNVFAVCALPADGVLRANRGDTDKKGERT